MAQIPGDVQQKHYKLHRDHQSTCPREVRNLEKGFLQLRQREDGFYEVVDAGDEINWIFWPPYKGKLESGIAITHSPSPRAEITGVDR